jgi:hypothetical protein
LDGKALLTEGDPAWDRSAHDCCAALDLAEPGSDDERLEELALGLAGELRELEDVESIGPATSAEAPEGTRSSLAAVAGALVLSVRPSARQLLSVLGLIREWLRCSPVQRRVKVTIDGDTLELTGASDELQTRWLTTGSPGTRAPERS